MIKIVIKGAIYLNYSSYKLITVTQKLNDYVCFEASTLHTGCGMQCMTVNNCTTIMWLTLAVHQPYSDT